MCWRRKRPKRTFCKHTHLPGTDYYNYRQFLVAECDNHVVALPLITPVSYIGCADLYNGLRCSSCGRPIKVDYTILEELEGKSPHKLNRLLKKNTTVKENEEHKVYDPFRNKFK